MESTGTDAPASKAMGVPAAIVVAGALIAAAIYVSNRAPVVPAAATPAATNAAQAGEAARPQASVGPIRPVGGADHVRGADSAKLTLVEYSDLECPFCKDFHATLQQVLREYPNDVRWVYRHLPLEQLHHQAKTEAVASECAAEQGKFWEFVDNVFATTTSNDGLDLKKLPELARAAGVANVAAFDACRATDKFNQRIADDAADAQSAGARGTPYLVIQTRDGRNVPIEGALPFAQVKTTIDGLL